MLGFEITTNGYIAILFLFGCVCHKNSRFRFRKLHSSQTFTHPKVVRGNIFNHFFQGKNHFHGSSKEGIFEQKVCAKSRYEFREKNVLCKSWRSSNQGRIFLPFFKLRMQINFFGSIAKGFCSSIRLLWNEYPSYTLLALTNIGVKKQKIETERKKDVRKISKFVHTKCWGIK